MRFTPIKVGERRAEHPLTFGGERAYEGRVVYVHPTGRWYTVEFDIKPQGPKWLQKHETVKLRESFQAAAATHTAYDGPRKAGYQQGRFGA
jgi:hypothetical protein